jgi:Kef-type K+ transport system membrane component KefB
MNSAEILVTLGAILLLGLLTSTLGQRTALPRVTLLLILGLIIGESGLQLVPEVFTSNFELIASMTLVMVGFLLGGKLTAAAFNVSRREILWISVLAAVMPALLVGAGLLATGHGIALAIMLGTIAAATAPAAILDVVMESAPDSRYGNLLLAIVAVDDVWGLILFSSGIAIVSSVQAADAGTVAWLQASREIFGAIALGLALGFPGAALTGRIKPGQPMLTEALGLVFLCGGLALWLEVSFLIAPMVMGTVIANFARHHEYPFHAIEGVEWPFMAILFVLAGATLQVDALASLGILGAIYVACRLAGKVLGGYLGGLLSGMSPSPRRWIGLSLLPHAGVPIGMALVAANAFPEHRQALLSVVIASSVVFELVGPLATRIGLGRMNAAGG